MYRSGRCLHIKLENRCRFYIYDFEVRDLISFVINSYPVCCDQDLWKLDLNTNVWEQLNLKGAPSPRSGHRMVRDPDIASAFLRNKYRLSVSLNPDAHF